MTKMKGLTWLYRSSRCESNAAGPSRAVGLCRCRPYRLTTVPLRDLWKRIAVVDKLLKKGGGKKSKELEMKNHDGVKW